MANLKNTTINDTGFIKLPSGTIAQRPVSPSAGMFRYNTDFGAEEYYNGTRWMTTSGRESIVQNGLQLWLDSGITSSYSGSGTTWTDLSGNGRNATLINGPGYNANNKGSLTFDDTDDYARVTNDTIARIGSSNHTISVWVNPITRSSEDFVGTGSATGSVLLMLYFQAGGGLGGFRGHAWSSTGAANTIDSPRAIPLNSWSMLTQRVTWGGNIDLIENDVVTVSQTLSGGAPSSSLTNFFVGVRDATGVGGSVFNGRIAVVQVYNRALTNAELAQNFNALRYRFGV
jgi:hypothetical protein